MKLLLTSDGITNISITNALLGLLEKDPKDSRVAYITTAGNIVPTRKNWLIKDLARYDELFPYVDVFDFSSLEKEHWEPRLAEADVIVFSGGNPFYLLYQIRQKGMDKFLTKFLESKILVGVSAGSMVMGANIAIDPYEESKQYVLDREQKALAYMDINFIPHFGSVGGKDTVIDDGFIKKQAKKYGPLYALDDDSALAVDKKVVVISEGVWKEL